MKVGVYVGVSYGVDSIRQFLSKLISLTQGIQWFSVDNSVEALSGLEGSDVDMIIVFGGDGSLLRFIHTHPELMGKPILHVGAGRINFLSEILVTEEPSNILRAFKGDYYIDERYLLSASFNGSKCYALNEIVVRCTDPGRMATISVTEEHGEELMSGRMDGLIVATPTGSTAYSLALGGPVVDYRVKSKLIVPIAPFSRTLVPIVHPYDVKVKVTSMDESYIICDGFIKGKAVSLLIEPWPEKVRLVRLRRIMMYEKLRTRLLRP
ncbi:NAD(+)/NADH kinase [Caldivirga sp. UBA161]|uniref:NAD(+)/NADH kinase n=1 Tax=Caldivirga sp. UBA161 TaxID=1915569 RepID=UPI0025C08EE3|nr:NAD(+)/NADH kinase [Caldivirga sp. UBA161]